MQKGNAMANISRRDFLRIGAAASGAAVFPKFALGREVNAARTKIPMVHTTDLFRPYNDPDDHWDLACIYALAYRGDIDLKAVVIDSPLPGKKPDTAAIAQLNQITGLNIPAVVGCSMPMKSRDDVQPQARAGDHKAAEKVLDILRSSPERVIINVTGCCRDIALAGKKDPTLFKEKCAAIYLNAGAAKTPAGAQLEYNVGLDKAAYAAIFDLPCPIYWMPCFHQMQDPWHVREFGTFYKFKQDEILPHLSERMQKYFACMFAKIESSKCLQCLGEPKNEEFLAKLGANYRNMWCTGGFLHAAGKTVTPGGNTSPLDRPDSKAVFAFEPIKISVKEDGTTGWSADPKSMSRYIFHILDVKNYQPAMTKAMESLLAPLP